MRQLVIARLLSDWNPNLKEEYETWSDKQLLAEFEDMIRTFEREYD